MKILIISVFFPQENTIASLRIYSWAKYWSKMGHDVTVLTTLKEKSSTDLNFDLAGFKLQEVALPKFLENFIFPTKAQNNLEHNIVNNESNLQKSIIAKDYKMDSSNIQNDTRRAILKKLIYSPFKFVLNKFRKYGAFSTLRMPDKFDLWYFPAYQLAKKEQWDLVISSYGPYVSHLVAHNLKKRGYTKQWIADYRDLWTMNQAFRNGVFPFNLYEEYLEKKINLSADIVTTVSEPLAEKLKNKYNLNNIYTIENGFDFADIASMTTEPYWNDNKIHMIYSGSIYEGKQDPEPIFRAISAISKSISPERLDNFQLLFFGKIQPNIIKLVKQYSIEKWVIFKGHVSRSEMLRIQRDAHALLFLEFNNYEGILSGKIFEYLASKSLILSVGGTNTDSYVSNFIKRSNCGKVLGNDVNLIQDELLHLINMQSKIIMDNSFILNYDRKILAEKMLDLSMIRK